MKKFICVLLLFSLLLVNLSAINKRVYGGIGYASFDVEGLEDICLTDYPDYVSKEARVALRMESSNGNNHTLGGVLGFECSLLDDIDYMTLLGEIGVYSGEGKSLLIDALVGVMGRVPLGPFSVGLGAKAGYSALSVPLGGLKVMSGFTAPVIINGNIYSTGDEIKYYKQTLSLMPVLDVMMSLGGLSLNLSAAYQISLSSLEDYFSIGGKKIYVGNSHLIEYSTNRYEHTRSTMSPTMKIGKLRVQCCVGCTF